MRAIPAALATHLQGEVLSVCTCWKLTLTSGAVFGFTDHDRDLVIDGVTFLATQAVSPTSSESSLGASSGGMDITAAWDESVVTELQLLGGLLDGAAYQYLLINWADPSQRVVLDEGALGEVLAQVGALKVDLRDAAGGLGQTVTTTTTPMCRARLGDIKCQVALGPHTVSGTLTGVTDSRNLVDAARTEAAGYYDYGVITMTSGVANGLSTEIKHSAGNSLTLFLPFAVTPAPGDTYTLSRGCDGRFATCREVYDNVVNFRGEPYMTGNDQLLKGAA